MAVASESRLPTSELAVLVAEADAWTVVTVAGELDIATAPQLEQRLDLVLDAAARPSVALEVSGLGFCDSSGLGLLVRLWKRLQRDEGRLMVLHPPVHLRTLLKRTGLDRMFVCADDLPEPGPGPGPALPREDDT